MALGESIVAIGIGVAEGADLWPIIAASVLGLAVSGALWWAYFDVTALLRALAGGRGRRAADPARPCWLHVLHLPMIVGVVMLSLGLKKAILLRRGRPRAPLGDPLYGVPLAALSGGTALLLLAYVWFKHCMTGDLSSCGSWWPW